MRKHLIRTALGAALLLSVGPALGAADTAVARLQGFLGAADSVTACFEQVLLDEEGGVAQRSHGRLYILRPDRFRWEYEEPAGQLVVGDGKRIWLYDEDLEQVTVRPMDEAVTGSPAALLSGGGRLEDSFHIGEAYSEGGLDWVSLEPLGEPAEFSRLEVGMNGDAVAVMALTDSLGQRSVIRLTEVQKAVTLDPGLFRFQAPPGVDVIGAGEEL